MLSGSRDLCLPVSAAPGPETLTLAQAQASEPGEKPASQHIPSGWNAFIWPSPRGQRLN